MTHECKHSHTTNYITKCITYSRLPAARTPTRAAARLAAARRSPRHSRCALSPRSCSGNVKTSTLRWVLTTSAVACSHCARAVPNGRVPRRRRACSLSRSASSRETWPRSSRASSSTTFGGVFGPRAYRKSEGVTRVRGVAFVGSSRVAGWARII
ncbi:hypothetical protein T492DRAFT_348675 [Pavlovales sp. CCMP2436]|nr:hypothetical protein T492DRAFT_348675 [Pavlovales sp. CCMP2436]